MGNKKSLHVGKGFRPFHRVNPYFKIFIVSTGFLAGFAFQKTIEVTITSVGLIVFSILCWQQLGYIFESPGEFTLAAVSHLFCYGGDAVVTFPQ